MHCTPSAHSTMPVPHSVFNSPKYSAEEWAIWSGVQISMFVSNSKWIDNTKFAKGCTWDFVDFLKNPRGITELVSGSRQIIHCTSGLRNLLMEALRGQHNSTITVTAIYFFTYLSINVFIYLLIWNQDVCNHDEADTLFALTTQEEGSNQHGHLRDRNTGWGFLTWTCGVCTPLYILPLPVTDLAAILRSWVLALSPSLAKSHSTFPGAVTPRAPGWPLTVNWQIQGYLNTSKWTYLLINKKSTFAINYRSTFVKSKQ